MLQPNQEKSELIVFSSKHQLPKMSNVSLTIRGRQVNAVPFLRNLCVILDSGLTMEKQVNTISKPCFYLIRNIGQVRQCITDDACKILIQALVMSCLGYGIALLQGSLQILTEHFSEQVFSETITFSAYKSSCLNNGLATVCTLSTSLCLLPTDHT